MKFIRMIEDYFNLIQDLGIIAFLYIGVIIGAFVALLVYDNIGYSARIKRGSRAVIKFYKERGWVDNSNISYFIMKCVRRFPYNIRASFSLYTSSTKHLEEYVSEKYNSFRDYSSRERVIISLYEVIIGIASIVMLVYLFFTKGFVAIYLMLFLLLGIILKKILVSEMLLKEIKAKKYFVRALDLMYNGMFLPNHSEQSQNEQDDAIECGIEADKSEIIKCSQEIKDKITGVVKADEAVKEEKQEEIQELAIDKTH